MFGVCRSFLVISCLLVSSLRLDQMVVREGADLLIHSARLMSRPYLWTRRQLARLYSPLTLGEFGQCETLVGELTERMILAEVIGVRRGHLIEIAVQPLPTERRFRLRQG